MNCNLFNFTALETKSRFSQKKNNDTKIGAKLPDTHQYMCMHLSSFFPLSVYLCISLSLSLRSDINCLLPNLIRNFRRRDNLTSFLFSLTRSEPLVQGSRSQDFSIRERARTRRARPCSCLLYLFNLYRCVVYARVQPVVLSLFLSLPSPRRAKKESAKLTDGRERREENDCVCARGLFSLSICISKSEIYSAIDILYQARRKFTLYRTGNERFCVCVCVSRVSCNFCR